MFRGKKINNLVYKYLVGRLHTSTSLKLTKNEFEEVSIPVPWGHVAGKWWGDKNEIPVLALHGWQDNANTYDKLIPLLNLPSVLALDLPGHGLSSHYPAGKTYEFQEYLVLLHRIINYYNWSKVPLLAHSFSGALAFSYASIFSDKVKWLINFECARSLMTLYRFDIALSFSTALNELEKIEKQKKKNTNPAYKMSDMIQMTVEGSLGGILKPESAFLLLERGTTLAKEPYTKIDKIKSSTDLQSLINFEMNAFKYLSKEESDRINEYYNRLKKNLEVAKNNLKNFNLNENDNYYVYSRDPIIKIQPFQSINEEFVIEASKNIKCPTLFLRATDGFLHGTAKPLYDHTLNIIKNSGIYLEHHEVNTSHHGHLDDPENLAPIINKFVQNVQNYSNTRVWIGPKDQRPILCVHGWQDNSNSFKTLIPLLPTNYSYLSIDLPGHGLSSHIYKGLFYRIMEYVSVLRRIQHFYEWQKISFITHSYGSAMGFLFSSLFPKDVDFFVAIDLLKPTSWNSAKDFKNTSQDIEKMLKNDVLSLKKSPLYNRTELIERYVKGSHKSLTPKSAEILLERGSKEINGLYRYTRDVKLKTLLKPYFSQNELLNLSKRIECSVLFIKAEQSPFFENKENVESIMEEIQKKAKLFEYHILPGTHHLHINTPEIVAPVINSFIKKVGINSESFKLQNNVKNV